MCKAPKMGGRMGFLRNSAQPVENGENEGARGDK